MKILQKIYLLALALFIQACVPIELDKVDDEPVFTLSFTIDGNEYSFEAGEDEYFMLTEGNDPTFFPNPYQGSLIKRDLDGNPLDDQPSFVVSFQQSEAVRNSESPDHLASFKSGLIPISTDDDAALPITEVRFLGNYIGTGGDPIYTWDFGSNQSVVFKDPIHAYPDLSEYQATLTIMDDNQCSSSTTNTVSFDNRQDCYAAIAITNVNASEAILEANSTGLAPYNYLWSDGSSQKDNVVSVTSSTSSQNHCVTITDANGCQSISCIGVVKDASGDVFTCGAEMEESNYLKARSAPQFNGVSIDWRPRKGIEFFSREGKQPIDSRFEILSFEEFEENDRGQRTVKINFEVSCTVWETNKANPQILTGKGTLAVAIPD